MEVPDDAQSEQQKISSEATPDQDLSSASSKENKDLTENMDINTSEGSSDQDLGSSNEKRILKEDILPSTMEVPDDPQSEQQLTTSEAPSDHDSSSASSKDYKDSAENIDISTMEVPDDAQGEQQNITSEATPEQDLSSASSKENKVTTENMDINTSEASSDQDLGSSNEKRITKEDLLTSTIEVPDDPQSEQQNITSKAPSDQDSSSASSKENKDSAKNIDISTTEVPDDAQSKQQNITSEAASDQDSSSAPRKENKDSAENIDINTTEVASVQDSDSSNEKRILKEDILIVQSLIEQCMHTYMSRREVVQTLQNRDSIDPWFTTLVWQELEKQNAEFFKVYCTVNELINMLTSWAKKQCEMMNDPPSITVQIIPHQANKVPGDVAHKSEVSTSAGHPRENLRHLAQIPRAFGFTNLVSDSTNLEDLGPLGNYFGTPYIPSFRPVPSDEVNTEAKDQVPPDSMQDPSDSQ